VLRKIRAKPKDGGVLIDWKHFFAICQNQISAVCPFDRVDRSKCGDFMVFAGIHERAKGSIEPSRLQAKRKQKATYWLWVRGKINRQR